MQMLDVLKRLNELDAGNPNVKKPVVQTMPVTSVAEAASKELPQLPALEDMETLKALSGVKPIAECGPIGMMGGMDHHTPASFSLNASASTGDEVASMLTQIMNLAGVVKGQPDGGPSGDVLTAEPSGDDLDDSGSVAKAAAQGPDGRGGGEIMRAMMDKISDPTPEEDMINSMPGGDAPPMPGTDLPPAELGDGGDSPVADMADEVRDMADTLADKNEEEDQKQEESWDNKPNSPFNVGTVDTNAHAYQPNQGSAAGRGFSSNPRAKTQETIEQELFNEYQKFVVEAEEKTMSRAAKGIMKYGKKGMKALADAGKKGKDLEPVRAKYNKYD